MADDYQEANHRRRALAFLCLLAAAFLSSDVSLWHARKADAPIAASQVGFFARLSLNDSAVGRSEKRPANLEKDASRRSRCLGVPTAAGGLALIDPGSLYVPTPSSGRLCALTLISPPSDRAPPRATA